MRGPRRPQSETFASPTLRKMTQPYASVLVLAEDETLATELRALVDAKTGIIPVDQVAALQRNLRVLRGQRRMIILDMARRALLEAVTEKDLLEGAFVVLWKATPAHEREFRAAYPGVTIVRCGIHGGVKDLVTFIHLGR